LHRVWLTAIAVSAALRPGLAAAEDLDAPAIMRRAEALVQSLIGNPPADHEVIRPPGDIDPKMALAPPGGGTLQLVVPPERFRQR
jgi:hypothetical protein